MDVVSYSYRRPVSSGYRTRVVGTTSYNTSASPSQRVYVPSRSYYDDYDVPSRSTVSSYSPSSSYYYRRYSVSAPTSVSYRSRTRSATSDDLYRRSSALTSSLSSAYRLSSLSIASSRARVSSADYLNLETQYRPYRYTDVTPSRVGARSLNYYSGFSSSHLLGTSRSLSSSLSSYGDYDVGYYRPSYCPSTYRSYYGNLEPAWNRVSSSGYYSRLLDSLSLATPSASLYSYRSSPRTYTPSLSVSTPSSGFSYTPSSGSSWRRRYLDLDTGDLDGPVSSSRKGRDSDEVYFDKMHKILSATPNVGVPPEPSNVSGGVYLGTTADAENIAMMKAMRIQYVLNCAGGVGVYSYKRTKDIYGPETGILGYEELYADDSENYDIRSCFDRAHAFIEHARSKNARVLIHCPGVSRGGAIAISWLIREGNPLLTATKLVKDKRRNVLANTAFIRQLVEYARAKGQLDYDPTSVKAPTYHRVLHRARIISAHLPLFV